MRETTASRWLSAERMRATYAQASQDLSVHQSQLRSWVKALADDPQHAFPARVR